MNQIQSVPNDLRIALQQVLVAIKRRVADQRVSGRLAVGDALRGVAIEHGEAEQLVGELSSEMRGALPARSDTASESRPPLHTGSALGRAVQVFHLDEPLTDALALCLAVELDGRFGKLVAFLNDHIARTRPTLGLVGSLFAPHGSAVALAESEAVRRGLLVLDGDGPIADRALCVAPELLSRLSMSEAPPVRLPGIRVHDTTPAVINELAMPAARLALLHAWSASLTGAEAPAVLLLGGQAGSGRGTAVRAAAAAAGRAVVETCAAADSTGRLAVAAREAMWRQALLLVRVPEALGADALGSLWETLSEWPVAMAFTMAPELLEAAITQVEARTLAWVVEPPTIMMREALWNRLLRGPQAAATSVGAKEVAALAERFAFSPGLIVAAHRRAAADALAEGRTHDAASLAQACRAVGTARMGSIAQKMALPYTRQDLVLSADLSAELDLALAWMRHRRQVFEQWQFGRRIGLGRGMTALFAGPPGTGKTMAAQVLAHELGMDLFRVDLSRVMSKYIGETEKNLAQLFDDATASGAVLFFDEADALFGKRSEVKDAHDRYANLEISYLLQRMEEHEGISLLATNRIGDLDDAFTRRFHFILDFPMPRAPERRRIWEGMLPREAERDDTVAFERLAEDFDLSGGEIRNSTMSAAFAAAAEGVPIGLRHLKRGLRRELLKTGRVLDIEQRRMLAD